MVVLYTKSEAIEISQMGVNTTSMDKALTSAGVAPKVGGAQSETKIKKKQEKFETRERERRKARSRNN